ncbi:MAG: RNA methyltransferase [Acidobacteriota bacterium]|nr:RNA methyltransferase [Acidobacteriota bacterium]
MIARIAAPDDARLTPYRMLTNPAELARAGLFAVEGRLVVPRLFASNYRTHSLLVSDTALEALRPALQIRPEIDVLVASREIISATGGFDFHRGCLALGFRDEPERIETLLARPAPSAESRAPLVILEGISNPDNIGGIFRSAYAFNARAIVRGPACGDPLYRKAIRTSMGTTLELPWADARDWPADVRAIQARGYRVIALTTDAGAQPLDAAIAASAAPLAFLLGSEGHGLTAEALGVADMLARIPMPRPGADSLNVAAAASIALYASTALA